MQEQPPEEKEELKAKEEKIDIFSPANIEPIDKSEDPIKAVCLLLESHYRRVNKKADFDTSKLMAQAEFHVNSLIFLKETFPKFENEIICKLLNLLSNLITITTNNDNLLSLAKEKLTQLKQGLLDLKLVPMKKEDEAASNAPDKKISPNGKFFLNNKEISELISYFKVNFLPYINIWKHFNLDEKEVQNEKIEIIINKPILSMPLSMAKMKEEEKKVEETEQPQEDKEKMEEKKEEEKKEEEEKTEKKEEAEETYLDLLEKLNLNAETKKLIIEKIEELNKDVDGKIEGRQKDLDDKLKELEETVKGKKK